MSTANVWNKSLADTSLTEIEQEQLTVADFNEDNAFEEALETLREQSEAVECTSDPREIDATLDWELLAKCEKMADNADCGLYESEPMKLDFYQVNLSWFARIELAGGEAEAPIGRGVGAFDYDRDYSGLTLVIQDMGDIYAVYLKDYAIGYMRPFGKCVYMCSYPEPLEEGDHDLNRIKHGILPYLWLLVHTGEIDLAKEAHDYYHDIPDARIPSIEERINDLVNVQEAASMLGVSSSRVKKMVADRVIDGFKRNGRVWLSRAQVQQRIDYIAENGKPTRGKGRK